jgi:hypothetical protein
MGHFIEFLKKIKRALFARVSKLFKLLLYPYYVIRASEPVWHFLNHEGRRLLALNPPSLTSEQERILNELRRHGIAITHIDSLFPEKNILPVLKSHAETLFQNAILGRKKTFLMYLWKDMPTLDLENKFVQLGLQEPILNIINSYIGMWSKLDFYSANVTIPMNVGAEAAGSQRWHRDPGDKRICKMFVYLNDVDEETGPFMYIKGSQEGGAWRNLFPPRADDGWYPEGVDESPAKHSRLACTGRAGTLVFCDTTGIHKGGYSTKKERWMATLSYASKNSFTHPIKYRYPENFRQGVRSLTPVQKFAIDNL